MIQQKQNILMIASEKDPASINIRDSIFDLTEFDPTGIKIFGKDVLYSKELNAYLLTINHELIRADFLDNIPPEFPRILFLSKHASKSGIPALLVHFPGNWTDDNSMGGKPKTLSIADPILHKALVDSLIFLKKDGKIPTKFEIGIEVTHHGPTINKACTFVEIGSTPSEWNDKRIAEILAEAIFMALKKLGSISNNPSKFLVALGFGGPHYAPKFFSKMITDQNLALSHIAPKYVIDNIDSEIVLQAIEKSMPKPSIALIDWKGLRSSQRKLVIEILQNLDLTYKKI